MPSSAKRHSKLLAFVAMLVFLAGAGASSTVTQSSAGDHSVVVVNRHDDRSVARTGFSTRRELGDTVDASNGAAAVSADCTGCRTVAVAVQVVLVEGNPNNVSANNLALALNQNCSGCETMAAAYQYVVSTGGIVRFTPEGEQAMADLRHQISSVAESDLPFPEADAQLTGLVQQLWGVVDDEMRRVGRPFVAIPKKDVDVETSPEGATESPTPSPETTASPTDAAPMPETTESPTPCPTPTATTEPVDPSQTETTETVTPSPSPVIRDCPTPSPTESATSTPETTESSSSSPEPTPSPSPTETETSSPSPTPTESSSP
jgi:hypothetical protein